MTAYESPSNAAPREEFPFITKAREIVFGRVVTRLQTGESVYPFSLQDVRAYWFAFDADGWEVRISTTLPDSIHYCVRRDHRTAKITFDVYHKFDSQTFTDEES